MVSTPELEIRQAPEDAPSRESAPTGVENPNDQEKVQQLEDYLHKIEQIPTQTVTDDTQQPLLTPAHSQQVTITLPLTDDEINEGLHHKVNKAVRWLAAWCRRQAAKLLFKQSQTE